MIRLYANIFAGHRFDEYHRFNVYFQELVGKHTIGLSFCTFYLRDIGCILQALFFTLLSALYFGAAVEEPHHEEHINK
jgi:F-type H+-transporting ATPase subunit a